jgi:hypothetical protein
MHARLQFRHQASASLQFTRRCSGRGFSPTAYAGLRLAVMLDRSDRRCELPDGDMCKRLGGIDSVHRVMRALPEVCEPFWKTLTADGAVHAPRAGSRSA